MDKYKTTSLKQTQKFAGFLAKEILKARLNKKTALILALTGNLGSGKTTFTQGFLRGLGVKRKITSPTFIIMKKYQIPNPKSQINPKIQNYKNVYHIDCYRIKKAAELKTLSLKQILNNSENIVLIEWSEKIKKILPKNTIWIKFEHGERENIRNIKIYL